MTSTAPRWNRLSHEERRAQILDRACELFSKQNYAAVSMEDIAAASGVTRGLLNHYFGTKRDLYLEVIRYMTRLPPAVEQGRPGSTIADIVDRNVELYLSAAERNRVAWLAIAGGAGFGRDREIERVLRDVEEAYVDRVIDIFGGDSRTAAAAQRAMWRCYCAMAQAVSREWLETKRLSREQAHVVLAETLRSMVENIRHQLPA